MSCAADLRLHSRFAYATSPSLDLSAMVRSVQVKGIGLVAEADLTHPVWMEDLEFC